MTNDLTVEAWIATAAAAGSQTIVSKWAESAAGQTFRFYVDSAGNLAAQVNVGGGSTATATSLNAVADGNPHHVAFRFHAITVLPDSGDKDGPPPNPTYNYSLSIFVDGIASGKETTLETDQQIPRPLDCREQRPDRLLGSGGRGLFQRVDHRRSDLGAGADIRRDSAGVSAKPAL